MSLSTNEVTKFAIDFTALQLLPLYNHIQAALGGKELKRFRSNMQARERIAEALMAWQEANPEQDVLIKESIELGEVLAAEVEVEDDLDTPNRREMTYTEAGDPIAVEDLEKQQAEEVKEEVKEEAPKKERKKGSCAELWEIFDRLWNEHFADGTATKNPSRKAIIDKCVELGYNKFTARTQYQQFFSHKTSK